MCGKPDALHQLNTAPIDVKSQHKQLGFKFPFHIISGNIVHLFISDILK